MSSAGEAREPSRVVIAGGGVGAPGGALALRDLPGRRVLPPLLPPLATFTHRPLSVLEPFPGPGGRRYDLTQIARDAGVELRQDRLERLDPARRPVHPHAGHALTYDALLIAYGAEVREQFRHARTIDDAYLADRLRGLVQDVEDGYVRRVAFVATGPPGWPLPLYELALMTSRAAYDT